MSLFLLLYITAMLSIPGAYLVACCVLAGWLVFGRQHFAFRAVGYLLAVVVLGFLPQYFFDRVSNLTGHVLLGCSLIAILIALLRWLDFRIVPFATGAHRERLERSTGKTIDEWFRDLNKKQASQWPSLKIRNHLRSYGTSEDWVHVISEAYEQSIGRSMIEKTDTGEPLYIVSFRDRGVLAFFDSMKEQRWSIKQLMLAFVFVALFFSLVRAIPHDWLKDSRFILLTLLLAGLSSTLTIFVSTSCLSISGPTLRSWLAGYLVLGISFYFARSTSFIFSIDRYVGIPYICDAIVLLTVPTSIELLLAMMLIRQYGYRFVLVQRKPNNQAVLENCINSPTTS